MSRPSATENLLVCAITDDLCCTSKENGSDQCRNQLDNWGRSHIHIFVFCTIYSFCFRLFFIVCKHECMNVASRCVIAFGLCRPLQTDQTREYNHSDQFYLRWPSFAS